MIRLKIMDRDPVYTEALGGAITNLHRDFSVYTDSFDELFFQDENWSTDCDLYLISEGRWESETFRGKEKVICLTEEIAALHLKEEKADEIVRIYKYRRVQEIVADLRFIYGNRCTGYQRWGSGRTKAAAFFGAGGKSGRTVLALGTAKELVRHHDQRVFYLNYEEFSSTEVYLQGAGTRKIGEYLYYLLHRKESIEAGFLRSFCFRDPDGIEAFSPSEGKNDLRLLGGEELGILFKTLQESGEYDHILIDFGEGLNEAAAELLQNCDSLFLVTEDSTASTLRGQMLRRYLHTVSDDLFQDRLWHVKNRVKVVGIERGREREILVEEDEQSFSERGGLVRINIDQGFGAGVRRIADEIRRS